MVASPLEARRQYCDDVYPCGMDEAEKELAILIVEDQALVRAGLKALVERETPGCRVDEARSYEEATEQLEQTSYAFVFLDIDLGTSHTGLDVLRHIRARELLCRVIMLSASDDRGTVLTCLTEGASGYIPKSSEDPGVFRRAIETVLGNGVFLPGSILNSPRDCASPSSVPSFIDKRVELSDRQRDVLYYLCQGMPNKSIASRLGISEGTVRKSHVSDLLRLFGVQRRTELIIEVSRRGLKIAPPSVVS